MCSPDTFLLSSNAFAGFFRVADGIVGVPFYDLAFFVGEGGDGAEAVGVVVEGFAAPDEGEVLI